MEVLLKYGHETRRLTIGETGLRVSVLSPGRTSGAGDEDSLILSALAQPIGSPRLSRIVSPGQRVAILTADIIGPARRPACSPHCCRNSARRASPSETSP